MPLKNRRLDRGAKKQKLWAHYDLSGAVLNTVGLVDVENPIKITNIDLVYSVATSSHTQGETILVGTTTDNDHYCNITVEVSKTIGTVTSQTLLSEDIVTAGLPILIQKSAATGTSNTGEVDVVVTYEYVDVTANRI